LNCFRIDIERSGSCSINCFQIGESLFPII
jgi:hypothetical protein